MPTHCEQPFATPRATSLRGRSMSVAWWRRTIRHRSTARSAPPVPAAPLPVSWVKDGLIVAEWGEPQRVDMTFSATKSYVSTCVGLALDRGLIGDVDEPVCHRVPDGFADEHNKLVTWRHLLHQTSEWSGTLFGIPDSVDHNRSAADAPARKGIPRPLQQPGTFWEYNDVRVNALALAALGIWREPLPEVLTREVMQPIGASSGWRWEALRQRYGVHRRT